MTHVEFETYFAEQAERFGIAKVIRQRGEDYAFQCFMLAISSIVARDEQEPINEEELADEALSAAIKYNKELDNSMTPDQEYWYQEGYKAGYRKAWEDKQ